MPYSTILELKRDRDYKQFNGQQVHGLLFNLLSSEDETLTEKIHQEYDIKPFTAGIIYRRNPCLRFTFLTEELADTFLYACLNQANFPLKLGREEIKSEKVVTAGDDELADFCSYEEMLGYEEKEFRLSFLTPTTFRKGKLNNPLPDLEAMFKGLVKKWNLFAPYKYEEDKLLTIRGSIWKLDF